MLKWALNAEELGRCKGPLGAFALDVCPVQFILSSLCDVGRAAPLDFRT
jgi:hypothetical protein